MQPEACVFPAAPFLGLVLPAQRNCCQECTRHKGVPVRSRRVLLLSVVRDLSALSDCLSTISIRKEEAVPPPLAVERLLRLDIT